MGCTGAIFLKAEPGGSNCTLPLVKLARDGIGAGKCFNPKAFASSGRSPSTTGGRAAGDKEGFCCCRVLPHSPYSTTNHTVQDNNPSNHLNPPALFDKCQTDPT